MVLHYLISLRIGPLCCMAVLPSIPLLSLHRFFLSRLTTHFRVPTVLSHSSTGISTCCPSATDLSLTLGPDLPRADQPYPGILGYSVKRILTSFSLLIPAFSLLISPLLLIGTASSLIRMLPYQCNFRYIPQLRCCVSAPVIFGAGPLD